jgi:hypothetical protein
MSSWRNAVSYLVTNEEEKFLWLVPLLGDNTPLAHSAPFTRLGDYTLNGRGVFLRTTATVKCLAGRAAILGRILYRSSTAAASVSLPGFSPDKENKS